MVQRAEACSPSFLLLVPVAFRMGNGCFAVVTLDVGGAGVMLVQSATQPIYASTEVKSGDYFPLAAVGCSGQ